MDTKSDKQCGMCGENVPQSMLECPRCGRSAFITPKFLLYILCNGFRPDDDLCKGLNLVWLAGYIADDKKYREMTEAISGAVKFAFQLPEVPTAHWEMIASTLYAERIRRLHHGKEIIFKTFSRKKDPNLPDALLAAVMNADFEDCQIAKQLMDSRQF